MSRIEQLISDIESYIDNCKYYPLSNVKIIVNKEQLEDMLTELRLKTPDEVKKYQKILSNKEAILADAKEQAEAIINAAQIQTEVSGLIDNSVATQQLAMEEAVTVTKSIMASKSLIVQSIGRTITVMECYRTLKNKNKEVLVRIAYNGAMAKAAAKNAIRQSLENESEELHKKLDNVLGTK